MPVFPNQGVEELRSCIGLQYGERLPGDALTRKPGCARIPTLGDASAVSVSAGAVAAKKQLVFMPLEKIRGEGRIARQRVVARVGRKIAEKIRIIREPFVSNASANDRRSRVVLVIGIVRADVGPKCIAMSHKRSLGK